MVSNYIYSVCGDTRIPERYIHYGRTEVQGSDPWKRTRRAH